MCWTQAACVQEVSAGFLEMGWRRQLLCFSHLLASSEGLHVPLHALEELKVVSPPTLSHPRIYLLFFSRSLGLLTRCR